MNSQPLDLVLPALEGLKRSGSEYAAHCPVHEDEHQSLNISEGRDGRVLLTCHAGCSTEDVVAALHLKMSDLFVKDAKGYNQHRRLNRYNQYRGANGHVLTAQEAHSVIPYVNSATRQQSTQQHSNPEPQTPLEGCTLAQYSESKHLSLAFLKAQGITETRYCGVAALRIPYYSTTRTEASVRFRTALAKTPEADNRFRWKSGSKTLPYGLWRLDEARRVERITIVEGESDCHTLWLHNEPALGLPGANTWNETWAAYLEDIPVIYVVIEPDQGGETLLKALSTSRIKDRVQLVLLGEAKDPSNLYTGNPDPPGFHTAWQAALAGTTPLRDMVRAEARAKAEVAWAVCQSLAHEPDILARFTEALVQKGMAGEQRTTQLIYLILTSRFLSGSHKPVSAVIKGPSSAGKSHTVEKTLDFFPPDAYYALSAMSERALAYSEEPLAHRILVIYEAAGLSGDFASYLVRSLLSEGKVRYETVEKTAEGMRPRLIEREGPTGLLVTTTAVKLHPENETRLLSIPVADTQDQTRAVLRVLAKNGGQDGSGDAASTDLTEWHALQEWLQGAEHHVTLPYAEALAEMVPTIAVRLRRDFGTVLNLIRAHAILHQASRERDAGGRIVAAIRDYAAVRSLVADLIAEEIDATVSATIRETVDAVQLLTQRMRADMDNNDGLPSVTVSVTQLAAALKLDKGAVSRRVKVCIEKGYLSNTETRRGKPYKLEAGDPLPESVVILPMPEQLEGCCSVAVLTEGIDIPPSSSTAFANGKYPQVEPVVSGVSGAHGEEEGSWDF